MAKYIMSEPTRKFIWKMIGEAALKQLGEDQSKNNKEAVKVISDEDFKAGFNTATKLITSN